MLGLLTCCGPSSDVSSVMAWVPGLTQGVLLEPFTGLGRALLHRLQYSQVLGRLKEKIKFLRGGECRKEKEK